MLKIGDTAPDFKLADEEGKLFVLHEELRKGPIVLYFYPRDFTAGCTAEACGFRDSYDSFASGGYQVVGVSSDNAERHRRFKDSNKLPFRLLTDADRSVARSFGIGKAFGIIPGRVTFVISGEGKIQQVFESLTNIRGHVASALETIKGRG